MKFQWESLDASYTYRVKVFGGWIVRYGYEHYSMVFILDPNHEWSNVKEQAKKEIALIILNCVKNVMEKEGKNE